MWKRRKRLLEELDQDIREHIARETQENIESGMMPEEARYAAVRKFGNVMRVKEETREAWGLVWLEELMQDIRYGLRILANAPGFAAVAILTLALGIGANTAIFSLIDAVMLRSLPAENPSQLVLLKWTARAVPRFRGYMSSGDCPTDLDFRAANPSGCSFSAPMFREIRESKQFSGVAAFANSGPLSLTGNGPATLVSGQLVSGDFFETLGVKASVGRALELRDDSPAAAPVAVLSYGYWRSRFGGDSSVVGRAIELNGTAFTVVGVAERRFTGITPGSDYDVWLPLSAGRRVGDLRMWRDRENNVTDWWLTVVGRLRPNAAPGQAEAAISGVFRNEMLYGAVPLADEAGGVRVIGGPSAPRRVTRTVVGAAGTAPQGNAPVDGPRSAVGVRVAPPPAESAKSAKAETEQAVPAPQSGGTPAEASEEARTFLRPDDNPAITFVNAQTGLTGARRQFASPLYVMMCAVGIILLIACSNVAGLMLARAASRQKEMALRLALGAGRWRIARQLLTESLMLAAIGGVLGIAFASWCTRAIVAFVSSNQARPLAFATGVDLRALGFTVAISVLTGILFGIAPAFRSTRVDLTPALKENAALSGRFAAAGARRFSVGNALVVMQVALAIVVLIGAGLLVRTLQNLRGVELGFDAQNLVLFGVDPTLAGYKEAQTDNFYHELQARLAATPGVSSVGYSMFPLLSGAMTRTMFHWPGTPQDRQSTSDVLQIGPDFFRAMQIPLLAGRAFNASDYELATKRPAPPNVPTPVVVSHAFVGKYLGTENPLGKRFGESAGSADEPPSAGYEIIGVVRDAKYNEVRREAAPMMYAPLSGFAASFEVRTATAPELLVPTIRQVVAQLDPNLPLRDVSTQAQQIDRLLFQERLVARVSSFFGVLALVLACIGLYGLLAYEVARRTREIGIRMAIGAEVRDVLAMVVRQGLALASIGAAIGVAVALGVTRYLKSMLYEVRAYDPTIIVAVAALFLLVALAACFIPARRATAVDPMVALRCE